MGKTVAISLVIQTQDTAKRLAEVDFELAAIAKKLKEAKKAGQTDIYAGLKSQQAGLRNEAREVNKALRDQTTAFQQAAKSIPKDSLTGLTTQYRELRREIDLLSAAERKSVGGQNLIKQAGLVKRQIDSVGASVGDFRSQVGNYKNSVVDALRQTGLLGGNVSTLFSSVGAAGAIGAGLGLAAAGVKKLFDINKEISGLQAGVQKTTGLTKSQVDNLTDSLKQLDTVTTLQDLLKISEIAGRLGVQGEKGVLEFTKAIEKLNIALSDEFTGGAEQITDEVGRLSNVLFGATQDGTKLATNVLSIGNSLNVLAAQGAATAPVITDFATRIAGAAVPLGVTAGEVLGISATLQELGVDAERGATAVSKAFIKLTQNPKLFAKELGITSDVLKEAGFKAKTFTDLVNTDLTGALSLVASRVVSLSGNNVELGETLGSLGITGARELEVFLKLGQANERLSQNINTANKSLLNQNSLNAEVKTRQESLAGSTERLSNNFRELFVSSGLEDGFTNIVSGANDAVVAIGAFSKAVQDANQNSKSFNTTVKVGGELVGFLPNLFLRASSAVLNFSKGLRGAFSNSGIETFGQRFEVLFNSLAGRGAKTNQQIQDDFQKTVRDSISATEQLSSLAATKVAGPVVALQQELNKLRQEFALNPLSADLRKKILDTENKIAKEQIKIQQAAATETINELKSVSDQVDTIAANSIAGLEKRIADLRQKAREAPTSTIFASLTTQADALQVKLDQTQAKFERLVDAQRGITAVVNVLPTLASDPLGSIQTISTELNLEDDARIENEKEVLDTIARLNKVNNELLIGQRREAFDIQVANEEASLKQLQSVYEGFYSGIGDQLAIFTQDTLQGQGDAFKQFSKGIVITALEAVEKLIQLQLAQAFGISLAQPDSIATFGAAGLIKFGIVSGLIKGFFAAIKGGISNFDTGGLVEVSGRRVSDPQNIPTQPGGDNVLATLRRGEVVLNDRQQARLAGYAGSDVFHRIGVPGFAEGGAISGTPQILNPNVSFSVPGVGQTSVDPNSFNAQANVIAQEVARQVGIAVEQGFFNAQLRTERRDDLRKNSQA